MLLAIGALFLAQMILAFIVLCVLRGVLNGQLIDMGIERIEKYGMGGEKTADHYDVVITSHAQLSSTKKQRILQAAVKKLGSNAKVDFQLKKEMMGGMVVKVNNDAYSYSMKERLIESGLIKVKK